MSASNPIDEQRASTEHMSTVSQLNDNIHDDSRLKDELSKTVSEPSYPPASKANIIIAGLFLTTFLIALDRLIIGVAIPSITDEFKSLGDVGWYGSAYLLTSSAFMLFMGRVYTF